MSAIDRDRRAQLLARTALLGGILTFAIIASSAYLRVTGMGIGCTPWPECYGRLASPSLASGIDLGDLTGIARLLHRLSAMAVAVLVAFVLFMSLTRSLRKATNVTAAVALCLLTVLLAVVGRQTPGSVIPLVGVINVAGGICMLTLFGVLWATNRTSAQIGMHAGVLALGIALTILVTLQVALGALVSLTYSASACSGLLGCRMPLDSILSSLAEFRTASALTIDASGSVTAPLAAPSLQWLHRSLGWVLGSAIALFGAALVLHPRTRKLGSCVAAIGAVTAALGTIMVTRAYVVTAALAHNLCAATLLLALVVMLVRCYRVQAKAG